MGDCFLLPLPKSVARGGQWVAVPHLSSWLGNGLSQGRICSAYSLPPPPSSKTAHRDGHVTQARGPLQDSAPQLGGGAGPSFQAVRLGEHGPKGASRPCPSYRRTLGSEDENEETGMRESKKNVLQLQRMEFSPAENERKVGRWFLSRR